MVKPLPGSDYGPVQTGFIARTQPPQTGEPGAGWGPALWSHLVSAVCVRVCAFVWIWDGWVCASVFEGTGVGVCACGSV